MTARLHPAQAVLPGHPDKLCDAIADALVEEAGRRDPRAWCRVDVTLQGPNIFLLGRIAGEQASDIDVAAVVRSVCAGCGLGPDWGFDLDQLCIVADLQRGPATERDLQSRTTAEVPALSLGYALDLPGVNDCPAEQWLAIRILRRLVQLREALPNLRLGPAGQVVLLLEEEEFPTRLAGCSISLTQAPDGSPQALEKTVQKVLVDEMSHLSRRVPGFDARLPDSLAVNMTLPQTDRLPSGSSGRRADMDGCGLRAPHSDAVLCGRDLYQAERAGAILARRLAKAIVRTGVARQCQTVLALAPGQAEAQILSLLGDGQVLDASRWGPLLDRTLAGIGQRYTGQVMLGDIARYGHFSSHDRPWEKLHFDE
jgi:S-adenosylmethionine synthetase